MTRTIGDEINRRGAERKFVATDPMPLEIEAKLKLDSHEPLRQRLIQAGATRIGRALECNHIFDNADRTLLANDCGLRVRRYEQVEGEPRPATLTYKGRRLAGLLKTREEIEVVVDDGHTASKLLEALGFVEVLMFQKRRESWGLDECRIELDELPHLGSYVEIEGPTEADVRRTQDRLDLGHLQPIKNSYIALLIEHCRQHGLPGRTITFDA